MDGFRTPDNFVSRLTESSDRQSIEVAHIVLRTGQFETMLDWYKTALNAKAAFETDSLTFLSSDDEHHRIAIPGLPGPSAQPENVAGVHHVAFTYGSLTSCLKIYERLPQFGIEPIYPINHGPTTSLYYADPEGNQLEFQSRISIRSINRASSSFGSLRARPDRHRDRPRRPAAAPARR